MKGISERKRFSIFSKCGGKCAYCGVELSLVTMTVDHIVPRVSGGSGRISNLAPSCKPCNSSKGTKNIDAFKGLRRLQLHPIGGVINFSQYEKLVSMGVDMPIIPEYSFFFEVMK